MADRIRAFDWASTPLGPIDHWPDVLRTTVNTLLDSPQPIVLRWGKDLIQIYNDAYACALGAEKHPSGLGQSAPLCWPEAWPTLGADIESVLAQGTSAVHRDTPVPMRLEGRIIERFWNIAYSPVRDADGIVSGVLAVVSETTESVLAQRDLQRERERLSILFHQTPAFLAVLEGPDLVFSLVNAPYRTLVGDRDVIGKPVREAIPEAAEQGFLSLLENVYHTGTPFTGRATPIRLMRAPGQPPETRYLDFVYAPMRAADHSISGVMALGVDITEATLNQLALARSEARLQLAMDAADLGMWAYDPQTEMFHADANMQRIFGSPKPTGEHDFWSQQLHPDDRQPAQQAFLAAFEGEIPYEIDYRILHPEGIRWIHSKGRVLRMDGEQKGMFAIIEDITDRKSIADNLRDSEERLRLALSATREMGSFDWHVQTDRVFADENYCRIAGLDPEFGRAGMPIQHYIDKMHPDDRPLVQAAIEETVHSGNDYSIDYRVLQSEDTIRTVSARGSCLRSPDGTPVRFPGVIVDITDRKRAETILIQNEKLAAVGRLAASIAHEINNPLESVTNLIYLARNAETTTEARSYLESADLELRRASAITNHTLRFHRQSTRPITVSCLDILTPVIGIHESRLANSGIVVEKRKRAHRSVSCFDGEIRQVVGNIVGNAIDAMHPNSGRLYVRSREGCDWRPAALDLPPRPGLVLTIADSGPGMSQEVLSHLFEPFYTTKGLSGTGLGLWISKEIVERHRGYISIRSSQRPGRSGTVFTIFLPFDGDLTSAP